MPGRFQQAGFEERRKRGIAADRARLRFRGREAAEQDIDAPAQCVRQAAEVDLLPVELVRLMQFLYRQSTAYRGVIEIGIAAELTDPRVRLR